jgi:hypothetical protein
VSKKSGKEGFGGEKKAKKELRGRFGVFPGALLDVD